VRRLSLHVCVALIAATALAGCGAAPNDPDEQPPVSQAASSAEPRSYPALQLEAALPRGARQLHGFKVEDQCRDITRSCADGADPGTVSVFATTRDDQESILISVNDEWTKRFWRTVVRDLCPRGRLDKSIEPLDGGHFSPGERGQAHRTSTAIGTWRGLHCEKSVTLVFPSGYPSEWGGEAREAEDHTLLLTNGFHYLQVQSSRRGLTHQLAVEYLDRLV
jgi:hypothetical protein